jgi:hypothetical protein
MTVLHTRSPLQKPGDQKNAHDLAKNQNERERLATFTGIDHAHEQKG